MNMKLTALAVGGFLAMPLGAMSVSFASGKAKSGSKPVETKLQAKLLPAVGVIAADLEGKVKYKKKTSVTKGTEEEMEAKVESPIPNGSVGLDESNAADTTFLLKIFQGATTTEKGSCIILIKEIEFEYEQGINPAGMEAKYAAKVKEKIPLSGSASVSKKVGTCQISVLINNVPTVVDGVPDVAPGDGASIYALTPTPGTTALLSGTFQSGRHGDDDDEDDD